MSLPAHLAKHLKDVYFGGNWTTSNLREQLADVTWEQATTQVHSLNTIATLVYHINYYISAVLKVLKGSPLEAKDALSFSHPPIHSQHDWQALLDKTYADAENFAAAIAQLPEGQLWQPFTDDRYDNYYRNIQGIIEHAHYHLGQIVLIKKLLQE